VEAIAYRTLRKDDVPAIARVHWQACSIAYRFMGWSYSEDEVRDWYAGKFAEWDWGLVAMEEGRVVGFVATTGSHIDQLFIDPEHQSRSVGTALLKAALKRLGGTATLHVFEQNASARRFYERHGFREAGSFFNEAEKAVELVYRRG
jgi:ribosomal protein S18 acetylase RimI-like enzyme